MTMKELETLNNAVLCVMLLLVLAVIICVLTGNFMAGLIIFTLVLVCAEASIVLSNEYEIAEYYDLEEEELD